MNMKEELKLRECPFCGKTDTIHIDSLGGEKFNIRCAGCQLVMGSWHGLGIAIKAWNRKTNDEQTNP